jgi:hypothetical protein
VATVARHPHGIHTKAKTQSIKIAVTAISTFRLALAGANIA